MKKDKKYMAALIVDVFVAIVLWLILIALKAAEAIDMHWALVLSGLVWISWALFALTALTGAVIWLLVKLKRRKGRRKNNRRIIRQAKAAGVWGRLDILGGKALELKAWQEYRIKRQPGETDACLRSRIVNAIENEHANAPKWGG